MTATVHRFPIEHESAFVNAYLVETAAGVVAVDSLLTVSDSRAMREALEQLGKPLHAVLVTHSHPDHYAGLAQLVADDDVPIIAPQGVIDTIARDDAAEGRDRRTDVRRRVARARASSRTRRFATARA